MGALNILSVGNAAAQGQTVGIQTDLSEDVKISFLDIMNQMAAPGGGNDLFSQKQAAEPADGQKDALTAASGDFERYQKRENGIQQKSNAVDWKESQVSEKLEQFSGDVKEVLKEELGVSDEQIEQAMETLGLMFSDLMNPKQLAALTAELTGCQDMGRMLCNEAFLNVMQETGVLTGELLESLGVSADELTEMLTAMQESAKPEQAQPEQEVPDTLVQTQTGKLEQPQENKDAGDPGNVRMPEEAENANQTAQNMAEAADEKAAQNLQQASGDAKPRTAQESGAEEKPEQALGREDVKTAAGAVNETADGTKEAKDAQMRESIHLQEETESGAPQKENTSEPASGGEQSLFKDGHNSADNRQAQNGAAEINVFQQNVVQTAEPQGAQPMAGVSQHIDVADIIRQITEFSKMTVGAAETTLEMQLNPEHLGKIFLEVTAKEGSITARIMAQNEMVKEALETQLAELKQNMNQAGIKVDAVEVTIGSHEFEQGLEQDAKKEEQQAEEQEKLAKQTRRIDLNALDELNGALSEEESLAAQIMADQGNSIDYTA